MLTVKEAVEARRSIRRFRSDPVPEALLSEILEAARLAPSAGNVQPWAFLVVRDVAIKEQLKHICLEQKFVAEAPLVILCCADLESYSKKARLLRYQEYVASGTLATLSGRYADPNYMRAQPPPEEAVLRTKVIANTFIAITHMILMASAVGLSTCWVGGFDDTANISHLFGLRETLIPVAVIPVGYADSPWPPPRPRRSLEEILIKPQNMPPHTPTNGA
jgi:nitroreductase